MKDFGSTVEAAMVDWWSAHGEIPNLEFRFGSRIERRIFDASPNPYPTPKGSTRIINFLGMPVVVDDQIPNGEIHIADRTGKLLGKITGLDSV